VTSDRVRSAAQEGKVTAQLVGATVFRDSYANTTYYSVFSFQPSGLIVRFAQILKIINKLYFININYGKRLTAFLYSLTTTFRQFKDSPQNVQVYNNEDYRGKLSSSEVALSGMKTMSLELYLYGASWVVTLVQIRSG